MQGFCWHYLEYYQEGLPTSIRRDNKLISSLRVLIDRFLQIQCQYGDLKTSLDLPPRQTNTLRRRLLTRIFLDLKSLTPCSFNTPKIPKPLTSLGRTIETIGAIEKADVMVAFAAQDFQALPQPLRSIWPIFLLKTTVTTIDYWKKKIKT